MIGVHDAAARVGNIKIVPREINTFDIVVTDDNGVERTYVPAPRTSNGKVGVYFEYDPGQIQLKLKDYWLDIEYNDIKDKRFELNVDDVINLKPLTSEIDVTQLSVSGMTSAQLIFNRSSDQYMCTGVDIEVYNPYLMSWVCISDMSGLFGYNLASVTHKRDQYSSIEFGLNIQDSRTWVVPYIKPHIINDVRIKIKSSPLRVKIASNVSDMVEESDYIKKDRIINQSSYPYYFYPFLLTDMPLTISTGYDVVAYGDISNNVKPLPSDVSEIYYSVGELIIDVNLNDTNDSNIAIAFYQVRRSDDQVFGLSYVRGFYNHSPESLGMESTGNLSGFESLSGTTYKISDGSIDKADFNSGGLGDTSTYETYFNSYSSIAAFRVSSGKFQSVKFIKVESSGDANVFMSNGYVVIVGMEYGDKIHILTHSQS